MGNIVSANRDDFSNQRILRVTMACFLIFSLLELAAAIASGSLSMFGDAAAMLVDSFAYGMNLFAEKMKHQSTHDGPDGLSWIFDSPLGGSGVKRRLLFETVIPFISITCLIAVSLVVTGDAIRVLTISEADYVEPIKSESESEVKFMFLFSVGGLVLDLGCALIFNARGTDAFIEKKITASAQSHKESLDLAFGTSWEADLDEMEFGELELDDVHQPPPDFSRSASRGGDGFFARAKGCVVSIVSYMCPSAVLKIDNANYYKKNFNMISAFTHVSADLIRTISVFIAAIVSRLSGLPVATCDAYAALIVIVSIAAIIVPLVMDMVANTVKIVSEKEKPAHSLEMTSMAIL